MTQEEQLGLVMMLSVAALTIFVGYKILKWFINLLLSPVRAFKAHRLEKLEPAIQGIGAYIFIKCVHPLGQDIKGKKFASIDFESLKEKHRIPGHDDRAEFLNAIFFKEIDDVVKSIKDGETTNLSYVNASWIGSDYHYGVKCVSNAVRDYIKSGENSESFSWIKELGEKYADIVKRARIETAADEALSGEYEDEVEETTNTYEDTRHDDYCAPSRNEPSQSPRSKPTKYTIYKRTTGGWEYAYSSGLDSAQLAIGMAKNQVSSGSNRGCFFRVTDSNGVTIWTGQA